MAKNRLHILLAKTDALALDFKNALKNYLSFFNKNQGSFTGFKLTYNPKDETVDLPNKRGVKVIITTVKEKLDYFVENNKEYLNSLFSQEATNASGNVKAELIVDGESWGIFSSLELLRLKGLLENKDLKAMYANIPVRSDAKEWTETSEEMYSDRPGVFESNKLMYEEKTTIKESYILEDPNVAKLKEGMSYQAQLGMKTTTQTLGNGTQQEFTGEWSQRQKAKIQANISTLYVAVIAALKEANETEVVESALTADKLFTYLHKVD
jgi:hypothetical protein